LEVFDEGSDLLGGAVAVGLGVTSRVAVRIGCVLDEERRLADVAPAEAADLSGAQPGVGAERDPDGGEGRVIVLDRGGAHPLHELDGGRDAAGALAACRRLLDGVCGVEVHHVAPGGEGEERAEDRARGLNGRGAKPVDQHRVLEALDLGGREVDQDNLVNAGLEVLSPRGLVVALRSRAAPDEDVLVPPLGLRRGRSSGREWPGPCGVARRA
jgi:hypothetical protein